MAASTKGDNQDISSLVDGYDWSTMSANKSLLIDVGGATGHASISIACAHPGIRCVAQDQAHVVAKIKDETPKDVHIDFAAHDFFGPQTVRADAYLFRQIFRDWNDSFCTQILGALIPALKLGAKIIANDSIVPPPETLQPIHERQVRSMDMVMMSLLSSREREKADWEALSKAADARFQNVRLWKPEGAYLGLIEATWSG